MKIIHKSFVLKPERMADPMLKDGSVTFDSLCQKYPILKARLRCYKSIEKLHQNKESTDGSQAHKK